GDVAAAGEDHAGADVDAGDAVGDHNGAEESTAEEADGIADEDVADARRVDADDGAAGGDAGVLLVEGVGVAVAGREVVIGVDGLAEAAARDAERSAAAEVSDGAGVDAEDFAG